MYVSNLRKYDTDKWSLYVNQGKNATDGLDIGDYTYFASAKDGSGNSNVTEVRRITIDTSDLTPPDINFTSPTPANGTSTSNTSVEIKVSITESDLDEVIYNWNGTNYTMYNDSLVLMYNFDNRSALGESNSKLLICPKEVITEL